MSTGATPPASVHPMMVNGVIFAWCHRRPNDGIDIIERFRDSCSVIERMANGANRQECSPEMDRVIAALRELFPESLRNA